MPRSTSGKAPASAQSTDGVVVGVVLGPWGRSGDVKVQPLTDDPLRFSPGSAVYLEGRRVRVLEARNAKGRLLLKLDGIDRRTSAEALRGKLLTVPKKSVRPLHEGSYYYFQIIDMGVWTDDGEFLGKVKEILTTGGNDVYLVRNGPSKDLLVPALEGVVLEVSPSDNKMVVRLPEGLRDK